MKKILTIVMLCLIPLGALLLLLAQNVPGFAEGYAAAVYPVWSRGVNFVTSLLPFSLAEFLVYLAVPAALFFLIRFAARMIGGKGRRGKLLKRFSVNVGCLLGVLLFFFTVNCGINYHRDTFAQASGLPVEPSSEEELISLCQTLLEDVNRERRLVREVKRCDEAELRKRPGAGGDGQTGLRRTGKPISNLAERLWAS